MILRTFTWESRPMPRLSLERLLFRSLSSFKACACRMCFEGRKIRSGVPSLFCFHFFGWLRRRKRATKKIFLAAGLTDGMFQRKIEEPPQHGKRQKRKIPRRQAAAGRLAGDFREIPRAPLNIRNIGLSCLERCLLPLAPCSAWPGVFSDRSARTRKTPQRRSRLKEEFRGRWGGGAIRPTSKHVASSPQTNSSAGLSAEVVSCRVS